MEIMETVETMETMETVETYRKNENIHMLLLQDTLIKK